jgi:hypothetical protein
MNEARKATRQRHPGYKPCTPRMKRRAVPRLMVNMRPYGREKMSRLLQAHRVYDAFDLFEMRPFMGDHPLRIKQHRPLERLACPDGRFVLREDGFDATAPHVRAGAQMGKHLIGGPFPRSRGRGQLSRRQTGP